MASFETNTGSQARGGTESKVKGVVGRVLETLTGKTRTHRVDRDREEAYWRENFQKGGAIPEGRTYEDYAPAYRTGFEGVCLYEPGTRFEDAEPTLQEDYTAHGGGLSWGEARPAARAAWDRVESGDSFTIPLTEEELAIGKREVEEGTVRIRKVVRTEVVSEPVELRREEAVVEHVEPSSREIPPDAFKEGTIEVPLKREEAVVEKTAHVAGEVKVTKGEQKETKTVQEQVRKEDVEVEKEGGVRETKKRTDKL